MDVLLYMLVATSAFACGTVAGFAVCHAAWLWYARNRTEDFIDSVFGESVDEGEDEDAKDCNE